MITLNLKEQTEIWNWISIHTPVDVPLAVKQPHVLGGMMVISIIPHGHFQVSSEMFNWVQTQAGSLKDIHRVVLKPLIIVIGYMFRAIVLLEGKPSAQSEVLSSLNQNSRCHWKPPLQHDASTIKYEILKYRKKNEIVFSPYSNKLCFIDNWMQVWMQVLFQNIHIKRYSFPCIL